MKKLILISFFASIFLFSCSSNDNEPETGTDNGQSPNSGITFSVEDGEAVVTSLGNNEEVAVPSEVEIDGFTYPVTTIGTGACTPEIKILHLPSSIKKMEYDSFDYNNIEKLYIEDLSSWCATEFEATYWQGTTSQIWYSSNPITTNTKVYFGGEEVSGKLSIPEGVTQVSRYALANLNLTDIDFGPTLQTIGILAFYNNRFESLVIPATVETVAAQAFYQNPISEVTLPSSLSKIGQGAFNKVRRINVESLEYWMSIDFYDPNSYIDYEDSLWQPPFPVGYDLVIGGEAVTDLIVPEGTTEILPWTFNHCRILSVTFPETLEKISATAFNNCQRIEKLVIPGSVKSVDGFENCTALLDITLEEGVSELGYQAFMNCGLIKKAVLPSTIEYCDVSAILSSQYLEGLYVYATVPPEVSLPWNLDSILESRTLNVYVPAESIEAYKIAEGWKELKNFSPIPPTF